MVQHFSCCCSCVLASADLILEHITFVHVMCSMSVPRVSIRASRLSYRVETGEACYLSEYQMRTDSASLSWFFPQYRAWLRYSHSCVSYSTSVSAFKLRHREMGKGRNISSSMPRLRVCNSSGTRSGQCISLALCLTEEQTCR